MIINEVIEQNKPVTGNAGQQNSTGQGIWNPYTKQFQQLPSDSNHFQTAASLLQRTSETSYSATHESWLQQQNVHVSNTDEALEAELAKLSVPSPPVETARKETEPAPEKTHDDVIPPVTANAKAQAELNQGVSNPSAAVLNFQKSFTLLTEEEKQLLYAQVVTPATGRRPLAPGITDSIPTAANYFVQQPHPMHHVPYYNQPVQQYMQASYTNRVEQNIDPLLAIMSKPRLFVFQEFIKDLATAAIIATEVLTNKTLATKKLQDPTDENHIPRSIRNKNFTLTTIEPFKGHPRYKELVMKAAEICAQYKANLTETVRELATCELTWLKILRVQQILQPIQKIIASLVFQTEHAIARPSFPTLVQANTIHFFVFYWLIQLNIKLVAANQSTVNYVEYLGLPSQDILATAATILITNIPQAVANVIERINKPEMDWDQSNVQTGYYVNTILIDLQEIFTVAVIDNSIYQQSLKTAKIAEAQTQAFVNKLRTKTATELTNETLNRVEQQSHMEKATEKDLQKRQQELEASLKQTKELLQQVEKRTQKEESQQKNSPGSSSAQRPRQLKQNEKKPPTSKRLYHGIWTPPVEKETVTHNPEPTSNLPTEASTKPTSKAKPTNKAKPTEEEAKKAKNPNKKKRKFRKQPK